MDTSLQLQQSLDMARSYHDLSGMDKLRQVAKDDDKAALRAAAEQFEGIFMGMLLKSMRQASDVLADQDSPLNSQQVSFYRDMYDKQLTAELAGKQGLGLTELIMQQFGGDETFMPTSAIRGDGDLRRLQAQPELRVSTQVTNFVPQVSKEAGFATPKEFVQTLLPHAQAAAKELGIEPTALVAQAAVETGWGRYMMHQNSQNAHNLFGIKADSRWSGDSVNVTTHEYDQYGKKTVRAEFRQYDNYAEAFADYVDFIQSQPRYSDALNASDSQSYFTALQSAGYATDPVYANKIMHVLSSDTMQQALQHTQMAGVLDGD